MAFWSAGPKCGNYFRPNPVGDGTKWRVDTSVCHDKENRNSGPAVLTRGFDAPFGPFGASSCLFLELFDTGACLNPDSARRLVYFLSYMCGPKGRVPTRFRPRNCGSRVPILLIVTQPGMIAWPSERCATSSTAAKRYLDSPRAGALFLPGRRARHRLRRCRRLWRAWRWRRSGSCEARARGRRRGGGGWLFVAVAGAVEAPSGPAPGED